MSDRGRINSHAIEEGIMETTRESYQQKMEAQLKEWSTRLEALQAKVEKASDESKKQLLAELEELKKLQVTGREHFSNVATQTWDEVKTELNEKWNQVSGAVDAIWARVSNPSTTPSTTPSTPTTPSKPST
jgi:phage pi2 protein 07